jgi:hypothetical protein
MPPPCWRTLQWQLTWTLAFPTLVARRLFTDDHEPVWQRLAWQSVNDRVSSPKHLIAPPQPQQGSCLVENEPSNNNTAISAAWQNSVGYGEMTPTTVCRILQWARRQELLPDYDGCVVDLGSGNGNVLLAASLAHSFAQVIGLELVPQRHNEALQMRSAWTDMDASLHTIDWDLRCADFTQDRDWIAQADFVVIHATVFENELMERLNDLCAACRPGTLFCLVSRPLQEAMGIATLNVFHLEMNWGRATVYLQLKI